MALLDRLPGIVDRKTKPHMKAITVYPKGGKVFDPGTGSYSGSDPAAVTGRGLITQYDQDQITSGVAQVSDRQVIVILASLSSSVNFEPGVAVKQGSEMIKPLKWIQDAAGAAVVGHTAEGFG